MGLRYGSYFWLSLRDGDVSVHAFALAFMLQFQDLTIGMHHLPLPAIQVLWEVYASLLWVLEKPVNLFVQFLLSKGILGLALFFLLCRSLLGQLDYLLRGQILPFLSCSFGFLLLLGLWLALKLINLGRLFLNDLLLR